MSNSTRLERVTAIAGRERIQHQAVDNDSSADHMPDLALLATHIRHESPVK